MLWEWAREEYKKNIGSCPNKRILSEIISTL